MLLDDEVKRCLQEGQQDNVNPSDQDMADADANNHAAVDSREPSQSGDFHKQQSMGHAGSGVATTGLQRPESTASLQSGLTSASQMAEDQHMADNQQMPDAAGSSAQLDALGGQGGDSDAVAAKRSAGVCKLLIEDSVCFECGQL